MFSSLEAWCTVPVKRHVVNGYQPNGEPDISDTITIYGYVAEENVNIIDNSGHETLSSTQIYLDAATTINNTDMIEPVDSEIYNIKKIKTFYDGNTGLADIKVVYL